MPYREIDLSTLKDYLTEIQNQCASALTTLNEDDTLKKYTTLAKQCSRLENLSHYTSRHAALALDIKKRNNLIGLSIYTIKGTITLEPWTTVQTSVLSDTPLNAAEIARERGIHFITNIECLGVYNG